VLPLIVFLFLLSGNAQAKEPPSFIAVSFAELISSPQVFNKNTVALSGFLKIQHAPHEPTAIFLYSTEDAAGLQDDAIIVTPDKKLLANRDKLNKRYVRIVGKVKITPAASGGEIVGLSDVESCQPIPSQEQRR
jgi:hypothetical protein